MRGAARNRLWTKRVAIVLFSSVLALPLATEAQDREDLEYRRAIEYLSAAPDVAPPVSLSWNGAVEKVQRCATPAVDRAEMLQIERGMSELAAALGRSSSERGKVKVPLVFHIVQTPGGDGAVADDRIEEQVRVLNRAYRKLGLKFYVLEVRDVTHKTWFKKCHKPKVAAKMAKRLAIDPRHTINVYTCKPRSLLGRSTFPWSFEEDSVFQLTIVHHRALAFGAPPYDLGMTLVHELGHYFGVLHPFSNGCEEPGDFVDDTPFEESAAFGCQVGRDTCPQPGTDPVQNYMDYSDDACYTSFSQGQIERMRAFMEFYRPSLLDP